METSEQTVDVTTDDGEMAVVMTAPSAPPTQRAEWPVVVIFIDAPGLRPATRKYMARLASHGYRVITPDLHHRHGRLLFFESTADPSVRATVWGWINSMTDDQIQHDAAQALRAAEIDQSTPYATIGFCLGARAVCRSMERNPDRVVCGAGWHPSFLVDDQPDSPHLSAAQIKQPLYLGIGEDDEVQSIAMHSRFLDAVEPLDHIEVTTFAGADHGFTWPGHRFYHEVAAETSWSKTLALLESAFNG